MWKYGGIKPEITPFLYKESDMYPEKNLSQVQLIK